MSKGFFRFFGRTMFLCGLLTAFCALISGCLDAEKTVSATYDAKADEFRFLVVYQCICSSADQTDPAAFQKDLDRLKALYDNRDRLLLMPTGSPSPLDGLGEPAIVRASADRGASIDLSKPDGPIKLISFSVPLDAVKVLPGEFFLRGPDNLCYYHQMVLQGKAVDAYINYDAGERGDDVVRMLQSGIDRQKNDTAPATWDDFSTKAIDLTLSSMRGVDNGQKAADLPVPFEPATLDQLMAAFKAKQIHWVRDGSQVTMQYPMTEKDVNGAVAFCDAWRDAVAKELNSEMKDPAKAKNAAAYLKMMASATVSANDATHVALKVDLMKLFASFFAPMDKLAPLDDKDQARVTEMAHRAATDLKVNPDLAIDQISKDFAAGVLKANLPEKTVEPGEGLGGPDTNGK